MLKIPTFVLGGLLIITGLVGYLFQDPGRSLKITGPLADDAVFTLSDGNQTHKLNLKSDIEQALWLKNDITTAGDQAYWLVWNLNLNHAKDRAQETLGAGKRPGYKERSYWYASSKDETLAALMDGTDNLKNVNEKDYKPKEIKFGKFDSNESNVRLIFKNFADHPGPITLSSTNWKNIDNAPEKGKSLTFSKSLTALIPTIIGLLLIGLAVGSEAKPNLRKHLMHAAVLIGLLGFGAVVIKIPGAIAEISWLRERPFGIAQVSLLKPAAFVFTAGLLLIFVVLCIISFIEARKEMAAKPKTEKKPTPKKGKDDDFEGENKKDNSEKERKKEGEKDDAPKKTPAGKTETKDASSKKAKDAIDSSEKKNGFSKNKPTEKKAESPRTIYKPKPAPKTDSDAKTKPDSEGKTVRKSSSDAKEKPEKEEGGSVAEAKDKQPAPVHAKKVSDSSHDKKEKENTDKPDGDDASKKADD